MFGEGQGPDTLTRVRDIASKKLAILLGEKDSGVGESWARPSTGREEMNLTSFPLEKVSSEYRGGLGCNLAPLRFFSSHLSENYMSCV